MMTRREKEKKGKLDLKEKKRKNAKTRHTRKYKLQAFGGERVREKTQKWEQERGREGSAHEIDSSNK